MALNIKDGLQELFPAEASNLRFVNWLWNYALLDSRFVVDSNLFDSSVMRESLASTIRISRADIGYIRSAWGRAEFPDSELEWISKNNSRLIKWMNIKLHDFIEIKSTALLSNLSERDAILSRIDCCALSLEEKRSAMQKMYRAWINIRSLDNIFNWFIGSDAARKLKFAEEELIARQRWVEAERLSIGSHEELLSYFDIYIPDALQKHLLVDSMKKKWGVREYRSRLVGKRQLNVVLDDSIIELLGALATKHKIKKAEVIETLLRMEEERGEYLSSKR